MKKYSSPVVEILELSSEDIMTISGGLLLNEENVGTEGGKISFGDWGFGDSGMEV